ncbi:hypothetical protein BTHE_1999 [Bifidobacterium thermophilum]|nr:hypothetical protein BTHE_1999 [Bifidobacterium thermophilum]
MKRNGRTSAGRVRWRCTKAGCGASTTQRRDTRALRLRRGSTGCRPPSPQGGDGKTTHRSRKTL